MSRSIPALALLLCAACGATSNLKRPRNTLSFAHCRSLEAGLEVRKVLDAFGRPADVLREEGQVRGVTYWCEDGRGEVRQLRMVFTPEGRLERWVLGEPGA